MPSYINDTFTKGTHYCQFNFPQFLSELSACCGNETIHVFENCTQYGKVGATLGVDTWTSCLRMALEASQFGEQPGVDIERIGTGCDVAKGVNNESGRTAVGSVGFLAVLSGLVGSLML